MAMTKIGKRVPGNAPPKFHNSPPNTAAEEEKLLHRNMIDAHDAARERGDISGREQPEAANRMGCCPSSAPQDVEIPLSDIR